MELVFRALADPSRRRLLDALQRRDGQTLSELDARLEMTRFGVMKHLRVLEAAGLIVTRKVGREKFHYLNPVPIRRIHDRWIRKYAEPIVATMSALKATLEGDTMNTLKHVYEVYIRTTPEKLWEAITRPEMTRQYFYANDVESDWKVGSPVRHKGPDGKTKLDGKVMEVVPGRKLVTTFCAVHDPEAAKDRPSRVTWEIEPRGEVCRLTLTHDDFDGITATYKQVGLGWNPVLSGLKTLLETGKPLVIGPAPAAAKR
jgi:uncharacterized protein YndB with AHSA1/START domain/DNA-binding transcriptional ArsR family regulator